jgi:DNA-binding transcriptional MocR family regulator
MPKSTSRAYRCSCQQVGQAAQVFIEPGIHDLIVPALRAIEMVHSGISGPMDSYGVLSLASAVGDWRQRHGPLSRSLAAALRDGVLDGRIPIGVELPAEREVARALEISRGTVVSAFAALRGEGWIVTRHGRGSTVQLPARLTERTTPWSMDHGGEGGRLDMRAAVTAAPHHDYLVALRRATERLATTLLDDGSSSAGDGRLRESVAARYSEAGLPTHPDQILITTGASAAISLLIGHLHDRRRPVLVESPSYPRALAWLRGRQARLVTVPVTASGWDADRLRENVRTRRPALAYLMPDFHNPTGSVMPDELRAEIGALAMQEDLIVVADETMRDLDLRKPSSPPPHLTGKNVISVGSTSKLFWGGLRVGWIRAGASRIRQLRLDPQTELVSAAPLEQLIAAELLSDEARILNQRRAQLRDQRDHLVGLLRQSPNWSFVEPAGGLSVWLRLHHMTGQALADRTRERGLLIAPGPWFAADRTLIHYVRIPFTATASTLTTAVGILAEAAHGSPDRVCQFKGP